MNSAVIKSEDAKKRIVWAEVYAPNRPDSDGEFMDAEGICKMAYEFMRNPLTRSTIRTRMSLSMGLILSSPSSPERETRPSLKGLGWWGVTSRKTRIGPR